MTTPAGVVIAGGGLAGQRASETLRRLGYEGPIRMICREPMAPYDRPPLSKEFLAGQVDCGDLALRPEGWHTDNGVELLLGESAAGLDLRARRVLLASGSSLRYEQLLIATGRAPRHLAGAERFDNVYTLRTLADARALRSALAGSPRVVVVGAGFIGQEVAATASGLGASVTIVEAASAPLAAVLGERLGRWFARLHRDHGIEVLVSARIAELHGSEMIHAVELEDGRRIDCDLLVVGIGTEPATEWLRDSGLEDCGVRTDPAGRTVIPSVFAAGDASLPFDPRLAAHVRTEHWEAAARQGAAAARAMLGLPMQSLPLSSFWSDQFGIRIQFLGRADAADRVELDGEPAASDFSAIFIRSGRPIAALLVGRPHALPELRRRLQRSATEPHHERQAA
jgi:NADPH-dependent 2,4-dienoyl-CoA reductase/sulfur reductase-like enzyme